MLENSFRPQLSVPATATVNANSFISGPLAMAADKPSVFASKLANVSTEPQDWQPQTVRHLASSICEEVADVVVLSSQRLTHEFRSLFVTELCAAVKFPQLSLEDKIAAVRALAVFVRYFDAQTIATIAQVLRALRSQGQSLSLAGAWETVARALLTAIEYGSSPAVREVALRVYAAESWYHWDTACVEKAFRAFVSLIDDWQKVQDYGVLLLSNDNFLEAEICFQMVADSKQRTDAQRLIATELDLFVQWLTTAEMKDSCRRIYLGRVQQVKTFYEKHYAGTGKANAVGLSELLSAYIANAKQDGTLTPVTINNVVSTFRMLGRAYGVCIDGLCSEPLDPKWNNNERTCLSQKDQDNLIAAARAGRTSRDVALVLLFLCTGIKIGECTHLKTSDLVWSDGAVKVRIIRKNREVCEAVPNALRNALQSWILERQKHRSGQLSDHLFPGQSGGQITTAAVDIALRKVGWRAALKVNAGVLRNTYLQSKSSKARNSDQVEFQKASGLRAVDWMSG